MGASKIQDHRSKLLNRLGIYEQTRHPQLYQQITTAAEQRKKLVLRSMGVGYIIKSPSPCAGGGTAVRITEPMKTPLKWNNISRLTTATEKNGTRIRFCEEVDVMPIPTRHEYSNRIKSQIWSNIYEIEENAERNKVEFAAEGWNWENATEDDSMYICKRTGELVHPVHLEHRLDSTS